MISYALLFNGRAAQPVQTGICVRYLSYIDYWVRAFGHYRCVYRNKIVTLKKIALIGCIYLMLTSKHNPKLNHRLLFLTV